MTPALSLALLVAANLMLLALPLLPALLELRRRGLQPLHIPADDEAGIRYFADSFRRHLEADLGPTALFGPGADAGGTGIQSVPLPAPAGAGATIAAQYRFASSAAAQPYGSPRALTSSEPVLVGDVVELASGSDYLGEIYARHALTASHGSLIRAILCDGAITLGTQCGILRWAHARRIVVGAGSRAMGRVSATESLHLGPNCAFERISAPTILIGAHARRDAGGKTASPGRVVAALTRLAESDRLRWDPMTHRWMGRGLLEIADHCAIEGNMVVHGDLVLGSGCAVHGSIKCHGSIMIGRGTTIDGNCFALKRIHLGADASVTGQVSSLTSIQIDSGCVLGRLSRPASTIASELTISGDCVFHGSLWARATGRTFPA